MSQLQSLNNMRFHIPIVFAIVFLSMFGCSQRLNENQLVMLSELCGVNPLELSSSNFSIKQANFAERALNHFNAGQYKEALEFFLRLRGMDCNSASVSFFITVSYGFLGDVENMDKYLMSTYIQSGDSLELISLVGTHLEAGNRQHDALRAYAFGLRVIKKQLSESRNPISMRSEAYKSESGEFVFKNENVVEPDILFGGLCSAYDLGSSLQLEFQELLAQIYERNIDGFHPASICTRDHEFH